MEQKNLIGKTFGKLLVIGLNNTDRKGVSWLCRCICGKEIKMHGCRLIGNEKRRPTRSCGCSQYTHKGKALKHKRIYSIWKGMIDRCYKPHRDNYERYGGKGVTISNEWRDNFDSFLDWSLKNGYKKNLTIDRIDYEKPYSADNCKWSDYYEQAHNKGIMSTNKTGCTGVCVDKNGYRAYITRFKKKMDLGRFETLSEAVRARKIAEKELVKSS